MSGSCLYKNFIVVGAAFFCLAATVVSASVVRIDSLSLYNGVMDDGITSSNFQTTIVLLDSKDVYSHSSGDNYAIQTNDWQTSSEAQLFKFDIDHARAPIFRSTADTYVQLYITPNRDIDYSIEGTYGMVGDREIAVRIVLEDLTTPNTLFDNRQTSQEAIDESFIVGETAGDYFNDIVGSISGTLTAGHAYRFVVTAFIDTGNEGSNPYAVPTTASGSFSLLLGAPFSPEVIPVLIDIKPSKRSSVNEINLRKEKVLSVAVVGDGVFDALQVDPATVRFGPGGAVPLSHKVRDYNRDGFSDLILNFDIHDTGIACGLESAQLIGATYAGEASQGIDSFTIKKCK